MQGSECPSGPGAMLAGVDGCQMFDPIAVDGEGYIGVATLITASGERHLPGRQPSRSVRAA